MKKTIYLDMDGVLTDFNGRVLSLYGADSLKTRKRENWVNLVQTRQFETLDMLPSARILLDFVDSIDDVVVEILSSSGGSEFHTVVEAQKLRWLQKHGIRYKANIVPGGYKKAVYANPLSVLVDDTLQVVENFAKHGGATILHDHKFVEKTIDKLRDFLYN